MLNPIRLCNNLFDDPELSGADLRSFAEDHLVRVANNNPGTLYSQIIIDTSNKYTAYFGKMTSERIQLQIKEGITVTKRNARTAVEEKLGSLQGLIKFKFGETSAIYQEFYPQGMTAFLRAKDADLKEMLVAFNASMVSHLTADFPAEVAAFGVLKTDFENGYTAQRDAFSLIDNIITGKNEDHLALTKQLTFNFLIIASNNIGNPDKFDDFYDPRFLPITNDAGTTPVNKQGMVNAGANKNIDLSDIPDAGVNSNLKLFNTNTGMMTLRYYYADTTMGYPIPSVFVDVQPGETLDKLASQLGASSTKIYLMVQNLSGIDAKYEVEIVP